MFELSNINLSIWLLSVVSGVATIFFYFSLASKSKRLPLATHYEDLNKRCEIIKEELQTLQTRCVDYESKKAEHDLIAADIEQKRNWLELNEIKLQSLNAERETQEKLREEIKNCRHELKEIHEQILQQRLQYDSMQHEKQLFDEEVTRHQLSRKKNEEENESLQISIEKYKSEMLLLQQQLDHLNAEKLKFHELLVKLDTELKEKYLLKEQYEQIIYDIHRKENHKNELDLGIVELTERRKDLEDSVIELQDNLKQEQTAYNLLSKEIENEKIERKNLLLEKESYESKRNVLKSECEQYQHKIDLHKAKSDSKNSLDELSRPYFVERKQGKNLTEDEALERLKVSLKESKLVYSERTLFSFHTSLKINDISPLVVLSGISGTGKSQLPLRYAQAMGIHFLNMAVQPRWDSPQDIFGFFNYLEHRYKSTELTQVLIQAERYNRESWPIYKSVKDNNFLKDQMVIVLFDEMNLARVEYYFSDFLSKLEMRRGLNPKEAKERQKAEILLDMGSGDMNGKELRLYVDRNVLFVGTMNEDESTQSLSDKILDRSNMIRFGKPNQLVSSQIIPQSNSYEYALTFENWNQWIKKIDSIPPDELKTLNNFISKLNEAMNCLGRPFGHRTSQAIQSYVANYPTSAGKDCFKFALADQIEQKIIPKLINIPCHDSKVKSSFEEVEKILDELGDLPLWQAFELGKEGDFFEWKGVNRE